MGLHAAPEVRLIWESPGYCHCIFTALETLDVEAAALCVQRLLQMDRHTRDHRQLMELEWVHRWVPPRADGYRTLLEAVADQQLPTTV